MIMDRKFLSASKEVIGDPSCVLHIVRAGGAGEQRRGAHVGRRGGAEEILAHRSRRDDRRLRRRPGHARVRRSWVLPQGNV